MAALRSHGWLTIRAAGSHGPFDLLALSPSGLEVALVQCKLGGPGRLAPAEWNGLFDLAILYGCIPVIASRPRRGRVLMQRLIGPKVDRGVRGPSAPCEAWTP